MKRAPERRRPSADRWTVPYADFLTLLLALFVVLYAASAVDATRFENLADGVRQHFGSLPSPRSSLPIPLDRSPEEPSEDPERLARMGEELRRRVDTLLSSELPRHAVTTELQARGLLISLAADALFGRDGRLLPAAEPLLSEVAAVLHGHAGPVRIEVHDSVGGAKRRAFGGGPPQRAAALARAFVERHGVPASQLAVVSYGAPSDASRIDVVVLSAAASRAEPRPGPGDGTVRTLLEQLAPAPEVDADSSAGALPFGDR